MANNLGFIDIENNNLLDLAVDLGALTGTNTGGGFLEFLADSASSDKIDFYRFEVDTAAPINSYIELSSADVVNIEAFYQMRLYSYDAITASYTEIKQSYQLPNNPFSYRIDLTSLASGTYVFGVAGAEWDFGNATGLYELRMSIPSQAGEVIDGADNGESLTGNNEENTINAKGGADTLNGGAGDDTLNGGNGNDNLSGGRQSDVLNGGNGIDRVIESGDLAKFILANDRLVGNGVDVLISIEQAQLTGGEGENILDASGFTLGSVTLNGGGDDDTLLGGSKNDRLSGDDGFDYLNGGTGRDTMTGGAGGDIYVVDDRGDLVIESGIFDFDSVNAFVNYTLGKNIEELKLEGTAAINGTGNALDNLITGNQANNTLIGLGGDDTLDGDKGNDTLNGGTGDDTYIVDRPTDVIIETSAGDFERVKSTSSKYTLSANLENLTLIDTGIQGTGNALDNNMLGNGLGNVLSGASGNDIINGSFGDDLLNGGAGDDSLFGDLDNDKINGDDGDDFIDGGVGNDTLNGGAGEDSFNDSLGIDTYVFQYGQSSFSATDQVDSFTIGSDTIDLLSKTGAALVKPDNLTRAADIDDFGLSLDSLQQIFIDANGKQAGNQALAVNSAAIVETFGFFNAYLVINDNTPGFQANSDLVINLATFGAMPPLGVIPVDTIFS